jgi:hypothetical protein
MAASPPVSGSNGSGGVLAAEPDAQLADQTTSIEPDGRVGGAQELGFLQHPDGAAVARSAGALMAAEVAFVDRAGGLGAEVFCPIIAVDPAATEPVVADERDDWAMMPDGIPGATVAPDAI